MQNLFNQDRVLSPASVRLWVNTLGALFFIASIIILIKGALTLFGSGTFLVGLLQISAGLGILLAFYLIVRLQAETLLATQRTNDRLAVFADALSPRITPAKNAKTATRKPAKAKAKSNTPQETDT